MTGAAQRLRPDNAAPRGPLWVDVVAALAAGAVQSLTFVFTELWALQWLCMAWLAWRVLGAPAPRRAAWIGAAYGSAWLASAVWWLFISMHRYGGLPAWVAALAVLLLSVALSAYLALAMAAVARAGRDQGLRAALWFALAWLAAELARGLLFTGFPWAASGYGQVDGPLAWLAPWLGVYGIGAVMALLAGWVVAAVTVRTVRAVIATAALALCILAGWLLGPASFSQPVGSLQVSLLQPNVAQDEKFAVEHMPATLRWVAQALFAARGDLVVAPETAVPLLPSQLGQHTPGYWPALQRHFDNAGAVKGLPVALIGVPLGDADQGYSNSVVGLGAGAWAYRYDKAHLVPFGEFIPPMFRWFTDLMNIPLGEFRRGDPTARALQLGAQRLLPNICFEDLFGEELATRFGTHDAAPTMLVNISNIGWFGRLAAPVQHLNISRMRALELQRPVLRATNTGATAIIDHRGQVQASLPVFEQGVLTGQVTGHTGRTPYAIWVSALGLWPLLVLSWMGLLYLGWRGRQSAPP